MASLNKVLLIGNLTRDPEMRYTPGGSALCNVGLAVSRRYATAQGEEREEVCFVDVEIWGKQAESCGNYLRKGSPVFVEGRLRLDQWDDKATGQKRSRLRVQAERVQFLSAPGRDRGFGGDGAMDGAGPEAGGPPPPMQQQRPPMGGGAPRQAQQPQGGAPYRRQAPPEPMPAVDFPPPGDFIDSGAEPDSRRPVDDIPF